MAIRRLNRETCMNRRSFRRSGFGVCAALAVLLGVLAGSPTGAEQPAFSEYQVKAAFLYNFAKFVEWPEHMLGAKQPIVLCVLGDDPFGAVLDETIAGKQVGDHPLAIKRFSRPTNLDRCHLLFVADSEAAHVDEVLARAGGSATLTVGESAGFAERGGMIGFVVSEHRVRFDVNWPAARAAGLEPSSQLLKVAHNVLGLPREGGR